MKTCIETKPLFPDIHIDQYNRLYIVRKTDKENYDYIAYRCKICKAQLSYFPTFGGITCTDNLLHKQKQ
jgi:hypothetical protein